MEAVMGEARPKRERSRVGLAWLLMCLVLAIHIAEEALTGFLPAYNLTAEAIRGLFPFLPVPTLSLTLWLTATIGIVAFLTALAPFAYRGFALMRVATVGLALVVLANVTGHIGGSLLAGAPMPGVYSTPLLAAAGVYGLVVAWRWEAEVTRAAAAAGREPQSGEGGV
jgi:hypothetical protein